MSSKKWPKESEEKPIAERWEGSGEGPTDGNGTGGSNIRLPL
jgi:hypothetical protein